MELRQILPQTKIVERLCEIQQRQQENDQQQFAQELEGKLAEKDATVPAPGAPEGSRVETLEEKEREDRGRRRHASGGDGDETSDEPADPDKGHLVDRRG